MIPDRAKETSTLIEIISVATPGQEFTYASFKAALKWPNKGISGYLTSARKYVKKNYGIEFMAIRGVGIRRMNANEIVESYRKGISHVGRTSKKYLTSDTCITPADELTDLSKATRGVLIPIFSKLLDETAADKIKFTIETARIDGLANLAEIIKS